MLNVRLAGDHLNGKLLFIWLSHVMFLMMSFCAAVYSRDVLDEIWDLTDFLRVLLPTFSHFGQLFTLKGLEFVSSTVLRFSIDLFQTLRT